MSRKMMTIIKNKTRMPHSICYELDGKMNHITLHPKGTYEIEETAKIVSCVPDGVRVLPPLRVNLASIGVHVKDAPKVEEAAEQPEAAPAETPSETPTEEAPAESTDTVREAPQAETSAPAETPAPEEAPAQVEEAPAPVAASNTANRRHRNRNRN